jgi:cystathionine beta-synthase
VSSHDEVGRALALMREHGVSQVPVVSAEDESVFVGVVSERGLLWASAEHPGILKQEVTEVLEPPLPELAPEDPAEDAIKLLEEGRQAVIVRRAGNPLGILTPLDLIEVLNR